jgi:hypothetical protein
MAMAIATVAVLVAIIYVFSVTPYLATTEEGAPSQITPSLEIIIPATALPLILALVFLVPARRKVEQLDRDSGKTVSVTKPQSYEQIGERRFRSKSLLSGAIGGLVAGSGLAGLIFAGDAAMGLPPGTFYAVIAIAISGSQIQVASAIYFGLALHLITGTLIGGAFGYASAAIGPFNVRDVKKGLLVGILAGFISFSLLFIPITRFQVEPVLAGILVQTGIAASDDPEILEGQTTDIMSTVLAFSIVLHVLYGAIMGSVTAILLDRLPVPRKAKEEQKDRLFRGCLTLHGSIKYYKVPPDL